MATKTVTIDLDAYERLRCALQSPDDSFSKVIKRAIRSHEPRTAAGMLAALERLPILSEATLDGLDVTELTDTAPDNPWRTE